MVESVNPLSNEQRAIIISVQADFDSVAEKIAAQLAKQPFHDEGGRTIEPGSEEFKCVVAQNVLRTCIEATLERMLPYSMATPVELGLRLASYCVSALPLEAQPGAVSEFLRVFEKAHAERMRQGIHLSTGWVNPGEDGLQDNVPAVRQ